MAERSDSGEVQDHELDSITIPTSNARDDGPLDGHERSDVSLESNHHSVTSDQDESSEVQSDDPQERVCDFLQQISDTTSYRDTLSDLLQTVDATKFSHGHTPLHVAAELNLLDAVELLLDHRAPLGIANEDGEYPLNYACRYGFLDVVVRLLDGRESDVHLKGADGSTPLDNACWHGREEIVRILVDRHADIQITDDDGWTPLLSATSGGHTNIVKYLLEKSNTNIDIGAGSHTRTPLISATENDYEEIVRLLLENHANVNVTDDRGWTALRTATSNRSQKMMSTLLSYHAKAEVSDNQGDTPLMEASRSGFEEGVRILRDKGVLDQKNNEGYTALHWASMKGYAHIVDVLLEAGASVNITDNNAETALHQASKAGSGDITFSYTDVEDSETDEGGMARPIQYDRVINLLVGKGSSLSAKTNRKETPLHLAAKYGNEETVHAILDKMGFIGDYAAQDVDGKTALHLGFLRNDPWDIMRCLLQKMNHADFGKANTEEDVIIKAAENQATHDVANFLLAKSKKPAPMGDKPSLQSAIEWAAYRAMPEVLWLLLSSSPKGSERDQQVKSALKAVEKAIKAAGSEQRPIRGRIKDKDKLFMAQKEDDSAQDNMFLVKDILEDPVFTQTSMRRETFALPKLDEKHAAAIKPFSVAVMEFYQESDASGFLKRFRTVREVVYEKGPRKISKESKENLQKLANRRPRDTKGVVKGMPYLDPEGSSKFMWVHLPATNVSYKAILL